MPDSSPLADRVLELEMLVTHLQRDLETLNSVVLDQQKQLDALRLRISKLDHRLTGLAEGDEPRNLLEERPPHY